MGVAVTVAVTEAVTVTLALVLRVTVVVTDADDEAEPLVLTLALDVREGEGIVETVREGEGVAETDAVVEADLLALTGDADEGTTLWDGRDPRLTDQELAFGDYSAGRYGWILEDLRTFKRPLPAKGWQRIWNWQEPSTLELGRTA